MVQTAALFVVLMLLPAIAAHAFPPYRSTDADTAGASTVELRLGLLRLERMNSSSSRATPLLRTNFGIGDRYEIVSEFDYSPKSDRLDEGALGFKWANPGENFGIGVETLMLLPVQPQQSGVGIESQFLATVIQPEWQLHINVGAFRDARELTAETGWRSSLLAEFPRGRVRPGIELFAKDVDDDGQAARVQAGFGAITQHKGFELRSAIHFGLNDASPDIELNVWFAWKWDLGARAD